MVGYYLFHTMQDHKIKKAEKAVQDGDLDTALSIFMNALRKNPNDIETLWHLGNINEEKQQYPEAIGYYSKLIELGKESKLFTIFELYKRIGLLYRKLDRDQDALDFLLQAYNMIQSSKEVLENIAMIIYSQKFFYRALVFFERAFQFLSTKPEFLKHYGLCLLMVDKLNDSVSILEESAKQDPHDYQTRYILSYVYLRIGAIEKARELIEDIVNTDRAYLNSEQLYFAIKMIFIIYLNDKNYEIVRELASQLSKINETIKSKNLEEEINMAYIFFRIKQSYYELALETISKNISLPDEMEGLSEEEKVKLKENKSHIYDLVSTLNRYKKESEKVLLTENKPLKFDAEFASLENKAKEAQKELDLLYQEWQWKFIPQENIWLFFKPKTKVEFDPTLILDKYAEDTIRSLKRKAQYLQKEKEEEYVPEEKEENPCERFLAADFPEFLSKSIKLAENMGYKVINQAVKIDSLAYSEGKAIDMLCEEKYQRDSRILFCIRRWKEPIGYISIIPIIQALKAMNASRLIIVSTSSLSIEALRAVEGNKKISFYLCNEVANYLV